MLPYMAYDWILWVIGWHVTSKPANEAWILLGSAILPYHNSLIKPCFVSNLTENEISLIIFDISIWFMFFLGPIYLQSVSLFFEAENP